MYLFVEPVYMSQQTAAEPAATRTSRQSVLAIAIARSNSGNEPELSFSSAKRIRSKPSGVGETQSSKPDPHLASRVAMIAA
jgi:hypothetical protein